MWKSKGIKWIVAVLLTLTMLMGTGCTIFNTSPEITSLTSSATSLAPEDSCTITCAASDPDGDTIIYEWTVTGGAISGEGSTVTWVAPVAEGTYTISVTIRDGKGGTASDSLTIHVINTPPEISSLTSSATSLAPEDSCTVSCIANDPDGDTLTYEWAVTDGAIIGEGSTVTWEGPVAEGTYTISVTVSDGKGGTATDSCIITVEIKFGSIVIQSSPSGAAVYLDGVDTGNITPYIITNVIPDTYTIKLEVDHYKYREATITVNADETTYINWSLTWAPEETITIQPDAAAGKDSFVVYSLPSMNYGSDNHLYAGARAMGTYRAYLQFDLASIPDDAVIVSARLGLYYYYNAPTHAASIGAYLVQEPWTEGGVTWDNQPTSAATPEGTYNLPGTPTNDFRYWYITELVKGWGDGSILNYGLVLKSTNESSWEGWTGFYSSDHTASYRPKLVIYYYDPTP